MQQYLCIPKRLFGAIFLEKVNQYHRKPGIAVYALFPLSAAVKRNRLLSGRSTSPDPSTTGHWNANQSLSA